jgi:hypothetical protein
VAAILGDDACVEPWPPQTLGPSPSDGILDFVLTDPRYGRGPYAVTGTYPDYTVYVEDGFGDLDYNDNILSCHFTPANCPPSGDQVLDDPAARHQFRGGLNASNPNASPGSGQKKEHGGIVWKRPDNTYLFEDIPDPGATECHYTLPGGNHPPPESGMIPAGGWHTHPHTNNQKMYGCDPATMWSQVPGDHKPVAHAAPNTNGGGSEPDWSAADNSGIPMYIINNMGKVWRLDPNTPQVQHPFNNHHWNWKNPSTAGCITP